MPIKNSIWHGSVLHHTASVIILGRTPLEWNRSVPARLCGILGSTRVPFAGSDLPAYIKSSKKIFGKNTNYIRHIHLAGKRDRDNHNNKMERLNGEIMDRKKVFRDLEKFDTPLIDGLKAYYNFTKKHGSLKGRTPAEEALIEVDGENKWITLIQNVSLHKENSV